jgi:hypothetical protein
MEGFVAALVFVYRDPGYPEYNHPVGGERRFKPPAVYVYQVIYAKPPGDFLNIPFGKNDKIFIRKHIRIITIPPGKGKEFSLP